MTIDQINQIHFLIQSNITGICFSHHDYWTIDYNYRSTFDYMNYNQLFIFKPGLMGAFQKSTSEGISVWRCFNLTEGNVKINFSSVTSINSPDSDNWTDSFNLNDAEQYLKLVAFW